MGAPIILNHGFFIAIVGWNGWNSNLLLFQFSSSFQSGQKIWSWRPKGCCKPQKKPRVATVSSWITSAYSRSSCCKQLISFKYIYLIWTPLIHSGMIMIQINSDVMLCYVMLCYVLMFKFLFLGFVCVQQKRNFWTARPGDHELIYQWIHVDSCVYMVTCQEKALNEMFQNGLSLAETFVTVLPFNQSAVEFAATSSETAQILPDTPWVKSLSWVFRWVSHLFHLIPTCLSSWIT